MAVHAYDIAKAVGVSPATVSLVLRDRPGVSDKTRKIVLEKAQELGFEYGAKGRVAPTSTILFIIYKAHGQVVSQTPFFEELTTALSSETYAHGFHRLAISYFYEQEHASEQLKSLRSIKCAGIILLATELSAKNVAQFERLKVPIILLDSWLPTKDLSSVTIDNHRGIFKAMRYLVSKGHRNIGYLGSSVEIRNFFEREEGFKLSLGFFKHQGVRQDPFIAHVGSTIQTAYKEMSQTLDEVEHDSSLEMPTAFIAANDIIAVGCIRALKDHGYEIPWDVSVIGFDNTTFSVMCDPPLTTLNVSRKCLGYYAVDQLNKLIEQSGDNEEHPITRISVLPTIVERESVIARKAQVNRQM